MNNIKLNKEDKSSLADGLQQYCESELDIELGQFDAEFIVEHLAEKLGIAVYNQALADAQQLIERKLIDVNDELYQLEKYPD